MKLRLMLEISDPSWEIIEDYELPDDWDTWSDGRKRDYAQESWDTFRDNHTNGSFCLVDDEGEEHEIPYDQPTPATSPE